MKVLFLTNIPSPYRVSFFNELGKYCDLSVVYERNTARDRDINWLKNKVISFREVYLKGIKIGNDSAFCLGVIKWLKDKSYDLIVVGGYSTPTGMLAIIYLNYRKIPFILNSDGGMIKHDGKFRYQVKKYFISKALAYLSSGKATDQYLMYYGAKNENIYRYPFSSVKTNDILKTLIKDSEKDQIKSKLGMREEKIVLAVGQFIKRKGFDILLKACRELDSNVGVYIVGGDPLEEYIHLVKNFNLNNVHFIGHKEKTELQEFYRAADLFVLPTRKDIWGLVINEAMAYGLPVITTDKCIAGLELVKNYENGFIIPIEDYRMLSQRINILLENDKLRLEMSENNLKKIRRYTIENMAKVHDKLFKKLEKSRF